jgi:hypothetical protein
LVRRSRKGRTRSDSADAHVLVAEFFDRRAVHMGKALGGAEQAGHQEIELRPELAQVVFQRRAGQRQAVPCLEFARHLVRLRLGILDELGLVHHQQVPVVCQQGLAVAHQQRIGGQHQVGPGDVAEQLGAILAMQDQHLETGGELRRFVAPVGHQAGGGDHQAGPVGASRSLFQVQVGQGLHRLAQAHVVGEDAGEAVFAQELQPVEADLLIGAQRCGETGCRRVMRHSGKIDKAPAQGAQFFAADPVRRQLVQPGQHGGIVARQARPVFVEEFEQGQQPGLEASRRHRQDAPRVERDRKSLAVFEATHHAEQVRLFAQQAQQRRHQADALAGHGHAEVEIEPVAADALLDRDEPVLGLGDAIWKVIGERHCNPLPLQFGNAFVEEGQPAHGIVLLRHQAVLGTVQPLVVAEAALPVLEPGGRQDLPDLLLGLEIALQGLPASARPQPHQGRRPLGADHGDPLRIVEIQHRQRHLVVQAAHRHMAEAPLGQQQARDRLARGHRLRRIRQRQCQFPFVRQLRQLLPHQRRIGLVQRRRPEQLLQQVWRQVRLQLADDSGGGVQVERRRAGNHLQGRRQIEAQLLEAVRIVGPAQIERPGVARPQRQLDQSGKIQPAGAQRQAQQQGAGLADEVDRFVVEIAATRLQGEEQAQRRDVVVEDELAVAARTAEVKRLRAVNHGLAKAPLLLRATLAQAQAGRISRLQQIHHPRLGRLCRRRAGLGIERAQPVEGCRTGFGIVALMPPRRALRPGEAAHVRRLFQRQQDSDHVLAVLAHGTHAGVVDVDDRAAGIRFQPKIDLIRLLARALNLGLDMNFPRRALDTPDPHPPLRSVGSAALQGARINPPGQAARNIAIGNQVCRHSAQEISEIRGSTTLAHAAPRVPSINNRYRAIA